MFYQIERRLHTVYVTFLVEKLLLPGGFVHGPWCSLLQDLEDTQDPDHVHQDCQASGE